MTFTQSIKTCFSKYADFDGRAPRSEYWYFVLFLVLVNIFLKLVTASDVLFNGVLPSLFGLATLLPAVAVTARRLHDTDRSGWWQLLNFIPIIGWLVLLVWLIRPGTKGKNRFG